MGASATQATHVVEVRLERPQAECSGDVFAHLHSAADGGQRYKAWGEPQTLGLLPDDIITVSLYTAEGKQHFDRLDCEEYAEVYLPWDVISGQITDGAEDTFVLGLQPGSPWLGQDAQPVQYRSAFSRARRMPRDNPAVPQIRIGVRMLPHNSPTAGHLEGKAIGASASSAAASTAEPTGSQSARPSREPVPLQNSNGTYSAAVACGVEELSPEEMKRLFQLQMINKELRTRCHLGDGGGPDVEDQVREHLERMRRAVSQNYALRAALQQEDRELAELNASLTQEQLLVLTWGAATPVPRSPRDLVFEEEAEREQFAAAVLGEIQTVTSNNIELITRYDQEIKQLEAELVAASTGQARAAPSGPRPAEESRFRDLRRRLESQMAELDGVEEECAKLEGRIAEDGALRLQGSPQQLDLSGIIVQKLQLEHEVQEEEIGHLRQILERQRAEGPPMPPGTGVLQDQVEVLQAELSNEELRGREERQMEEQQVGELRHESGALAEDLEFVLQAKREAEHELEGLRALTPSRTATIEFEQVDEEVRMESLKKETTRCQLRIDYYDQQLERLRAEAGDMRHRASYMLQAASIGSSDREAGGARITELEEKVRVQQEEADLLRCRSEQLREEGVKAQQAINVASVLAEAAQDKIMLLKNGGEVDLPGVR